MVPAVTRLTGSRGGFRRWILEIWSILLALSVFFVGLQAFLMSDALWILPVGLALATGTYLGLHAFCTAVIRGRRPARVVMLAVAALHLLPALFMLAGLFPPTVDGLFTAVVALLLLAAA